MSKTSLKANNMELFFSNMLRVMAGVDVNGNPVLIRVNSGGGLVAAATPASGTPTNDGGTITTGGTAQDVAVAKDGRAWFLFQNVSDTEMWVNIQGAAAAAASPSFRILPNGGIGSDPAFCTATRISVFCTATGKAFSYNEF